MADYVVTGKKGSGKTLFCTGIIRDALIEHRRVATNIDVRMEHLCIPMSRQTIIRLPDRPTVQDMLAIGYGAPEEEFDEDKNGVIVLDEASHFLNARSWGDKDRQPLIDWLTLSRKYNWNTYFLCQGLGQIDKQIRDALVEYHVAVKRTDRWSIPVITSLTKPFVKGGVRFPKLHIGIVKHGMDRDSLKIDTIFYRGKDLFHCYNTKQKLVDRDHPQSVGLSTMLSAWHIHGRYLPPPKPKGLELLKLLLSGHNPYARAVSVPLKPKLPIVEIIMRLPPDQRIKHFNRIYGLSHQKAQHLCAVHSVAAFSPPRSKALPALKLVANG
jgi:hypothetical protein